MRCRRRDIRHRKRFTGSPKLLNGQLSVTEEVSCVPASGNDSVDRLYAKSSSICQPYTNVEAVGISGKSVYTGVETCSTAPSSMRLFD